MGDLAKKLFWPKRDHVKIFEQFDDEDSLNEFLGKINEKGGKVVEIQNVTYAEQRSHITEVNYMSNENVPITNSIIHEKTTIHYRCYEKIKYLTKKEKEYIEKLEEEEIKHLKKRSRMHVYSLKKENQYRVDEERIMNEEKEIEKGFKSDSNNSENDLPF